MKKRIKILHLEDSPSDAELIAWEMEKAQINFEIDVVHDKTKFIEGLRDFSYDLILSDHSLASFNSHEALKLVKKAGITVPFILVTSTMTDEFAAEVMREGASDYIIKDRLKRLPSAVINSIEKHGLEEEKNALLDRLSFHIENTPLGFIEWDYRGFAITWSRRCEEIFAWSEKEFIECQENGFIQACEEDSVWVDKIFEQLIHGEVERNSVQYRSVRKDGRVIWCEWFNSVLKDSDGKVKTIISLVKDITEQKQMEWQKDNILSMISHELNTPVTTIKAYGQIIESILEKKDDSDTLSLVKKMGSQVKKLTTLIETILDFTKIQKGKLIYNEVLFDFNQLIKDVIDDMQRITPNHEIIDKSHNTATIFGDKDKIGQVLNNLISNAVKYSPKAWSIVIRTKRQRDGFELSVQDFGIGISPQEQQNVFEQFYRVKGSKSTFPGMGIGLYICSEIIAMHRGKIWFESIVDQGSTFFIFLPFDHRDKTT